MRNISLIITIITITGTTSNGAG
ncbi:MULTISPECIES: thr operon leader peptide [unclassified Brenneria]|nr:thr operon leader peptide [Brenneria sp. L3-3C-1]NPD01824.1 thr operon leader peptide [Brenneria sp. hezel4-2-4]